MNLAVNFASMMGQGLLGTKVARALPGIARKLGRVTLRGLTRAYQDAALRQGGVAGKQLGDLRTISRMSRRRAFRDYRKVVQNYRQQAGRIQHFIEKSKHPAAQVNRIAGRLLGPGANGRPVPLTSHIKFHIINDLATMPIMYGMYRHEKSQYPEMRDTNFATYYLQSLPISIGFMGTLQAFRSAGARHINQRLVRFLRHTGMGKPLVKTGLAIQHQVIKGLEEMAARARYVKHQTLRGMVADELLSVKGLHRFTAKFARTSAQALRGSKITRDYDVDIIRASMSSLLAKGVSPEQSIEIGRGFSNSIANKKSKLQEWIETITEPGAATYHRSNITIGRIPNKHILTDVATDRTLLRFDGDTYKVFSPSKFIDNMMTRFTDMHVNIGPGSTLRPGRIITAAFKPFTSEFSKSVSSTVIGTGMVDSGLKTGGVIAAVTNRIALGMGAETRAIGHEEQTKIVKQSLGELFGPRDYSPAEREQIGEQVFAHMVKSAGKTPDTYGPFLFRRMIDDMLPSSSGDIFHVDSHGIISYIPKGTNKSFKMVGAGKFTHFTKEGKSVQAEAMNRMSGGVRINYTHLKTEEDLAIEAINQNRKPELSFLKLLQSRYELGGGGVKSVVDYISGYFSKFFDPVSPHNLFHSKNLHRTVQGLKAASFETADAFARSFNKVSSYAQERLYRFISNNGARYQDIIDALDGFAIKTKDGREHKLKSLSLVDANDRVDAINRINRFYNIVKEKDIDKSLLETLGSIQTSLLESGADFRSLLNTVNYDAGVTFGEKYESILLNIFLRSSTKPVEAIDTLAETARTWIPSSKLANLNTWKTIMQTAASGDRYLKANISTTKNLEKALDAYKSEVVGYLSKNPKATSRIGEMLEGKNWWMSFGGQMERYKYHRHSTSTLYAVPETGSFNPGLKRIKYEDADYVQREAEVMTNAVNSASIVTFASFNTANKVMGLVGLGIDRYRSSEQIIGGLIKKRVLPLAAAGMAYTVADSFLDHSPIFEGSPLDEGLTVFGANLYARAKIASAGITDAIGITDAAAYLEDLMPGTINSPLSGILRGPLPLMAGPAYGFMKAGMRGAVTGGVIGGSVSMLLGGFGLSAFNDWDISKHRAQVISELKGETEVKIKSGRFWELCLVAGQLVRTPEGLKPIEEIRPGERVFTHMGRWSEVSDISNRTDSEIYTIETDSNYAFPLELTGNHPLYVYDTNSRSAIWKDARDIEPGDRLLYPANNPHDRLTTYISETTNRRFDLNAGLGYLIGAFYGDVELFYRDGELAGFRFEKKSKSIKIIKQFIDAARSVFNGKIELKATISDVKIIVKDHSLLGSLTEEIFKKKDPVRQQYYNTSFGFRKALVSGILDYGGVLESGNDIIYSDSDRNVIHFIYVTCNEFNIPCSVRNINESYSVTVSFPEKITAGHRYLQIENKTYSYFSVRSVKRNDRTETVYDICVPGDHSFAGFDVIYHNSSGSFWGDKTAYYRPHMYHLLRSDYTDSPNFKTSMLDEIVSYIDPAVYNRMHYWSRPSLEHPGMLSNLPFIGPLIQLPGTQAHEEYWNRTSSTSFINDIEETRNTIRQGSDAPLIDQLGLASGMGGSSELINTLMPNPRSSSSIETRMSQTFYNMKELAGLRGFLTEQAQYFLTGESQMYSEVPVIDAPNIGGIGRSFWGLELGGGAGLTEPIRRLFPRKTAEIQYYNPTVNLMPTWLPGKDYYLDIRHGDPYDKVQLGEVRLPGESYEAVKDVRHSFPGNADLLGLDLESAIQSYAGNPEYLISRYREMDFIESTKERIIEGIRAEGALLHENSIMYDPETDITAKADILIQSPETEQVMPVKFAPYLKEEGGFLAGSQSALNAYLVLSGYKSGKLVGITEDGEIEERVVYADEVKYQEDTRMDLQARQQAMEEMIRRREEGLAVAPGMSYSHVDRLRILGDVAFYSEEYKTELAIVKARLKAGLEPANVEEIVDRVERQVEQQKNKMEFMPERFLSSFSTPLTQEAATIRKEVVENYSLPERMIGGAWEYVSTLRNPITRKLIGNRTALQAYEEDVVYGKAFKVWQEPIESFVKPFVNLQLQETDPLQSTMSGATAGFIFGGGVGAVVGGAASAAWSVTGAPQLEGYIPEDTRLKREIMAAADIAEEQRYTMLEQLTGSEEFKYRKRNTISNALNTNQVITQSRLISLAGKPEKQYLHGILNDLNTGNIDRLRDVLPENVSILMDRSLGVQREANPEEYAGEYRVNPEDVNRISQPIEDIVVRTFEQEGLNAKDVGLGWNRTMARMRALERMRMHIPAMETRSKLERKNEIKTTLDPTQIKKTITRMLRGEASNVSVINNNGPLEVVIEVV